jgi:cyclic pyranopterin phosphate synthase
VSLDTLRPDRLVSFARSTRHADIIAGIRAARDAGLGPVKINSVIVRGFNDDEVTDLLEFARAEGAEVRYIEYMDVGGATRWSLESVVSREEILARLGMRFGRPVPAKTAEPANRRTGEGDRAPAERYVLPDGTVFGIIASVTAPFCRDCDRSRITADGTWLLCLYADNGLDLREPLRRGATDEELLGLIRETWAARRDRGAEERAKEPGREALYSIASLRADPRREMHTRGG